MSTTELAVGDSVRLDVHFLTGFRLGQITKTVQIKTTFSSIAFYLPFKANIFEEVAPPTPISFEPLRLYFSHSEALRDSLAFFEIRNDSDNELKIDVIDHPAGRLAVSDLPAIPPHDSAVCQVRLLNPDFTQSFNNSITLEAVGNYRYTIPIVGSYIDMEAGHTDPPQYGADCDSQ